MTSLVTPRQETSPEAQHMDPHLQVKISPILMMIRDKSLRVGPEGFQLLGRTLGVRDESEVKMSPEKFRQALTKFGIVLTSEEMGHLTQAFRDGQGYIRATTFVQRISSIMGGKRKEFVNRIFEALDVNGSGAIDAADLRELADFANHPSVLKQIITEEEAIRQYLDAFDTTNTPDGMITKEEFVNYYAGVSVEISSDEYFFEMVKSAWTFPTKKGDTVLKTAESLQYGETQQSMTASPSSGTMASRPKGMGLPPRANVKPEDVDGFVKPRRTVGYTGHVPLAAERFGETFHNIEVSTPALPKKERIVDQRALREHNESMAFVRKGNKANNHSCRLA